MSALVNETMTEGVGRGGREKNQIKAAQMFCEIELGQRLGPNPGWGGYRESSPHADSQESRSHAILIPQPRVSEFRRYLGPNRVAFGGGERPVHESAYGFMEPAFPLAANVVRGFRSLPAAVITTHARTR